ncbi:hypothetical protein ACFYT4_29215 [Streptomyces sp. NPDC004609]|uniref:hypothetical protein n=1 Tax=Streptomyces sp. NPDC004609 TaxID=3364704 RepID=UPI00368083B0
MDKLDKQETPAGQPEDERPSVPGQAPAPEQPTAVGTPPPVPVPREPATGHPQDAGREPAAGPEPEPGAAGPEPVSPAEPPSVAEPPSPAADADAAAEQEVAAAPESDTEPGTTAGSKPASPAASQPAAEPEPVAASAPPQPVAGTDTAAAPRPVADSVPQPVAEPEPVAASAAPPAPVPVAPVAELGPQATPTPAPAPPPAAPPVAAVTEPGPQVPPAPARTRRRGATALLIAVAAVIGVVAGTAVGYGVQAEREPTPLPALSARNLTYPAKPLADDKRRAPLSAAEDRQVRTDGDLRKLLLPKPPGERVSDKKWRNGAWVDPPAFVMYFDDPSYMLGELLEDDIRRIAGTEWKTGNRETQLYLVQFRGARGAQEFIAGQQSYMGEDYEESSGAGNEGDPVKGSGNGRYYLYEVQREAGYLPFYRARALVQRGDIAIVIDVYGAKAISKKTIRTLAERQLERL